MGFVEYLSGFVKSIGFFIGGFIIMFIAGQIMSIGSTHPNPVLPAYTELNSVASIVGIIVFVIGLAMVGYAIKRR